MANIYVVLSDTGTILSKIIKKFTGNAYNHASVSMTKDLSEMYSFGRRNPYMFFYGGFVHEYVNKGTFKRFYNTVCKVYEIPVSNAGFLAASEIIKVFIRNKKHFKYNVRGMCRARKNVNYQPNLGRFYCSQFVHYILLNAGVVGGDFFSGAVRPQDLASVPAAKCIYSGFLQDFPYNDIKKLDRWLIA